MRLNLFKRGKKRASRLNDLGPILMPNAFSQFAGRLLLLNPALSRGICASSCHLFIKISCQIKMKITHKKPHPLCAKG